MSYTVRFETGKTVAREAQEPGMNKKNRAVVHKHRKRKLRIKAKAKARRTAARKG
jgi:hypothetical protein